MKVVCFIFVMTFLGCTHKESMVYESHNEVISTSTLDDIIQKNKPIRLSYGKEKSRRGFLKKGSDSSYVFEPRKIGETTPVIPVSIDISEIKSIVVIEEESATTKDLGAILLIGGLILLVAVSVAAISLAPTDFK